MTTRSVLLVVGALLVAAVSATATLLITGDDDGPPVAATTTVTSGPTTPSVEQVCLEAGLDFVVRVYFESDDANERMRGAAETLREHTQVNRISTETREQAYERFRELFAESDPELVELARPESLPASVEVVPVRGVTTEELARDLETVLTGWQDIEAMACRTR